MQADYISSSKPKKTKRLKSSLKLSLALGFSLLLGGGGVAASFIQPEEVRAADIVQDVLCSFDEESLPREIYQATQSSDYAFELASKSSISSGKEDVDSGPVGLNSLLGIFMDFNATNEPIIGQNLDGFGDPDSEEGAEVESEDASETPEDSTTEFNQGSRVTPFDRFGVAGLNWSSYSGEWKYVQIDACAVEGAEPVDPKAGMYYEDRLEPRSTYEDISKTKDVRTAQFGDGLGDHANKATVNVLANAVFFITKLIVTVTIALVSFAFSDVVSIFGVNELFGGGENSLFSIFFNGIFTPLILLVMLVTAFWMLYQGIVKRQYRKALGGLIKSLVLFVSAIIIAAAPAFFIALPNQIAVVAQAMVTTTLSTGLSAGNGICVVGGDQRNVELTDGSDPGLVFEDSQNFIASAGENMRSAIGCQFWHSFLLKPWADGQFGKDWNELWAADKTPEWASGGNTGELENTNVGMVGDASVPIGGGEFINNWAIFHISTQTDAHSPIGHQGELSKFTGGVANDWWRIADATANYNEVTTKVDNSFLGTPEDNNFGDQYVEVEVDEPDVNSTPTDSWESWVGNSPWGRMGVAFTSILMAGVGLAAPLLFSLMSVIYAIGLAIIMAFAPIMFLLGCWADRGWRMFLGWAELLLDTLMKRIVTGLLMTFSIILTTTILNLMDDESYWWGFIALIVVSAVLIKSREKLLSSAAAIFTFKFSGVDLSSTASNFYKQTAGRVSKTSGDAFKFGAGALAGGVAARQVGGKFSDGMHRGARREFENISYRYSLFRDARVSYEATQGYFGEKEVTLSGHEYCGFCGLQLNINDLGMFIGGRDSDGNLYCQSCYENGDAGDANEFVAHAKPKGSNDELAKSSDMRKQAEGRKQREARMTSVADVVSSDKVENIGYLDSESLIAPSLVKSKIAESIAEIVSTDRHKALDSSGESMKITPEIPEKLRPFLTQDEAAIAELWRKGEVDLIVYIYVAAALELYYASNPEVERGSLTADGSASEEMKSVYAEAHESYKTTDRLRSATLQAEREAAAKDKDPKDKRSK